MARKEISFTEGCISFERLENGYVRIQVTLLGVQRNWDIDPRTWAGIVATVSQHGEAIETVQKSVRFPQCSLIDN